MLVTNKVKYATRGNRKETVIARLNVPGLDFRLFTRGHRLLKVENVVQI